MTLNITKEVKNIDLAEFLKFNNFNGAICEKFENYYNMLLKWGKKMNLFSRKDLFILARKHFQDSIFLSKLISKNSLVLDIGSGAGFPAIPLKIIRNDLKFFLVESKLKKFIFLSNVVRSLDLENMWVINKRIEDILSFDCKFDYITLKAVKIDFSLILKFLKSEGKIIKYVGKKEKSKKILQFENPFLKNKVRVMVMWKKEVRENVGC